MNFTALFLKNRNALLFIPVMVWCLFLTMRGNSQILTGSKYRYVITSSFSTMALDVPYGSSQPNTGIIQWHNQGSINQKWYFTEAGNGLYRIHSANSYLVLDVRNESVVAGAPFVQNYASLSESQKYSIENVGSGEYVIKAIHSGKVLDIKNASLQANAEIVQTVYTGNISQKWKIRFSDSIPDKYNLFNPGICPGIGNQYRLHSRSDVHLVWDAFGGGTQVGNTIDLYEGQGDAHQRFYFEDAGNQKYHIYIMHSGLVIQPENGSTVTGSGIVQMPENGSISQLFDFTYLEDGYYAILNEKSGLALTRRGKDIIQSVYTGSVDQQWKPIMTEGNCNGVTTGITNIKQYYTKTPENTCYTVRMFYVVPKDAPHKNRQGLCAALALSQQRTWADYGYTVVFEPIVVVNSLHDMNWFMTNGDNAWYSFGQNAELEVKINHTINYNNERLLLFVEGVCSAAAGGGGSASIPGCMIDGAADGQPNNIGVVGHELGHHMFGTGHPSACEKIFPQDNMCNNVYPGNIIYSGSYTDNHINGNEGNWIAQKSNCKPGLKTCNLPSPRVAYKIGSSDWVEIATPAKIGVKMGQSLSLSMSPHNLSYYRWYGPAGLRMRGDSKGNILISNAVSPDKLGGYRCVGINDEGCSVHVDIEITDELTSNTSEIYQKPIFQIRPNPATDRIFVDLKNWSPQQIKYSVINPLGQLVTGSSFFKPSDSSFELNTSNFQKGIYYISVEDDNGNKVSQMFTIL